MMNYSFWSVLDSRVYGSAEDVSFIQESSEATTRQCGRELFGCLADSLACIERHVSKTLHMILDHVIFFIITILLLLSLLLY